MEIENLRRAFEDLTQHEVEALKQQYNFADAHTHQSQSLSQMAIVQRLPDLWLQAENTKQEVSNQRFIEAFYKFRGLDSVLASNNVMLHYAASIATIHIANYLLKKRLSVSLIEPCFDNLYEILTHLEIPLHSFREELLHGNAEEVYQNLEQYVKGDAIFLVDPNNPTGFTLLGKHNQPAFESLVRFCRDHNKILILDYCFANFLMYSEEFELYDTYRILEDSGVQYMAIEDTGKTWPIQDAKVAMLKVSDSLYEEMYSIYTAYILNVSPFILNLLAEYILDSQNCCFASTRDLLDTNREILQETFEGTILQSRHAWSRVSVAWCEILDPKLSATELQQWLFQEAGIYVLPGTYFFWHTPSEGERYIRIALARDTQNFREGMQLIRQAVERLPQQSHADQHFEETLMPTLTRH